MLRAPGFSPEPPPLVPILRMPFFSPNPDPPKLARSRLRSSPYTYFCLNMLLYARRSVDAGSLPYRSGARFPARNAAISLVVSFRVLNEAGKQRDYFPEANVARDLPSFLGVAAARGGSRPLHRVPSQIAHKALAAKNTLRRQNHSPPESSTKKAVSCTAFLFIYLFFFSFF